ncbi:MAG: MliC family protein [Hyphomonadaceae bacterium]|nr:MliC family protein [Hyphomonadaceae bacterium]
MRVLALSVLLLLSACASAVLPPPVGPGDPGPGGTPPPIPLTGPIAYRCSDGTQLMVEANDGQARVAIVGGPSMVLPEAGDSYYSNGRYGFRGGGDTAQWEVGRAAPVQCRGS